MFGCVGVGDDPDKLGVSTPRQLCCIKCSPTLTGMLVLVCLLHGLIICLVCADVWSCKGLCKVKQIQKIQNKLG